MPRDRLYVHVLLTPAHTGSPSRIVCHKNEAMRVSMRCIVVATYLERC
jgi:hypothetical protein